MDEKTIVLAIAIDDRFSSPALVMLCSACRNLSPGWRIEVFILGYRLSRDSKAMISSGLAGRPVACRYREPDLGDARGWLPGLRRRADITLYFRLIVGQALPDAIGRVIFLDVDLFSWESGSTPAAELRRTFKDPKIVHFIGHWKPWGSTCCQMFHRQWRQAARSAGVDVEVPPLLPLRGRVGSPGTPGRHQHGEAEKGGVPPPAGTPELVFSQNRAHVRLFLQGAGQRRRALFPGAPGVSGSPGPVGYRHGYASTSWAQAGRIPGGACTAR